MVFPQDAEEFSSYDEKFGLPLVLAQGSPNIHSSCEGELGIALESMQDKKDLIYAALIFSFSSTSALFAS